MSEFTAGTPGRPGLEDAADSTILIAGASVRSAVSSLRNSDCRCIGIDLFGDRDTVENVTRMYVVNDADEFLARLNSYRDVPVIIAGQWPGLIAQLRIIDQNRLPLVNCDAWGKAVSLETLSALAKQCGVLVPSTIYSKTSSEVRCSESLSSDLEQQSSLPHQLVGESIQRSGRWLMKQLDSSGGLGVQFTETPRFVQTDDPLDSLSDVEHNESVHLRTSVSEGEDSVICQHWVPGRRWGASFIASRKQVAPLGLFRSSVHRRDGRPFTYGGSTGPYFNLSIDEIANGRKEEIYFPDGKADPDSEDNLMTTLLKVARALVSQTGILGVFNIDFIVDARSNVWLLEVNPRWTATCELSERAFAEGEQASVSIMKLAIDLFNKNDSQGEFPRWILQPPACKAVWMKQIVYTRSDVIFSLERLKQRCAWINRPSTAVEICDIPHDGTIIKKGDPICTLIMQLGSISPRRKAWEIRHLAQALLTSLDQAPTTSAAL